MDCNPVRSVLGNLQREMEAMNVICLHFNVTINALIEDRTKMENKKFMRRLCRCLRIVNALKPETSTFYKDRSQYVEGMLTLVGARYDDLKRRYLWALDHLADARTDYNRLADEQSVREARNTELGDDWRDFCKNVNKGKKLSRREEKEEPYIRRKGLEDIDKLLGLRLLDKTDTTFHAEHQNRRMGSSKVFTRVTSSPVLTMIEDLPQLDARESGDNVKSRSSGLSKFLKKVKETRKKENRKSGKIFQEAAEASEISMHIYALMAEIAERDELIDSLVSQMKIKDAQISQLLKIIAQEKQTEVYLQY